MRDNQVQAGCGFCLLSGDERIHICGEDLKLPICGASDEGDLPRAYICAEQGDTYLTGKRLLCEECREEVEKPENSWLATVYGGGDD